MNWKRILLSLAALVIICIALLGILALLNRQTQVVGLNQEIQYDDFAFAALGVRQAATIGNASEPQRARGIYAIVTMKIANHARRVDFTFDKSTVILVDEQGNEYHWSADVQRAYDATRPQGEPCAEPIAAGASCVTEVIFDVPATSRIAQVRISGGGPVGDVLDTIFSGKKRIALPPQ
jgi:Telomeric repeat-binding factor 2.